MAKKKIYIKGRLTATAKRLRIRPPVRSCYAPGDKLGLGYVVDEVVASGGSGLVLKAHKPTIRPPIYKAIKVINPLSADNQESRADVQNEFYGEAKISFEIGSDPYAIGVEDILEMEDGTRALVFPFIDGRTLSDLNEAHIRRGLLMPFELTAFIGHRILSVLIHAKERSIAHRDLCPNNIMVQRTGVPMLLDWGAGTDVNSTILVGKPGYIAPEAVKRPDDIDRALTFKGDVFSLGAIMRELLVGYNALEPDPTVSDPREALSIREQIDTDSLAPVADVCPDVPQALSDIVTACLHESPSDRPDAETLYEYMGSQYLYTPQVGFGMTAEVLDHYLRFFGGKWNPQSPLPDDKRGRDLAKIISSRVRRTAEKPEHAKDQLKTIVQQLGVPYTQGNVVRPFKEAHGVSRVNAHIRQLLYQRLLCSYPDLPPEPTSLVRQEYQEKRRLIHETPDEQVEDLLLDVLAEDPIIDDPREAVNVALYKSFWDEGL